MRVTHVPFLQFCCPTVVTTVMLCKIVVPLHAWLASMEASKLLLQCRLTTA